MLRMFSSARAKSCKTLLLWAHILGVTIATVVVDDSETDKIIYSDWWNVTHLCSGCTRPSGLPSGLPLGDTWRRHVGYNSDNWLALIDLRQWIFGLL